MKKLRDCIEAIKYAARNSMAAKAMGAKTTYELADVALVYLDRIDTAVINRMGAAIAARSDLTTDEAISIIRKIWTDDPD